MFTNNKYIGRSLWLIAAFLLASLSGCGGDGTAVPFSLSSVTVPPTVVGTGPANGATGVGNNVKLTATFSDSMASVTIDSPATNFTVNGGAVAGTVVYDAASKSATFTPAAPLAAGAITATITTAVTNSSGLAMASNYVWSFTVVGAADVTPPTVVLPTNPASGSSTAKLDGSVSASFSEDLDPATVNASTFTLVNFIGGAPVAGTVSYVNKVATFNPTANLAATTQYTATLTTGITDLAANAMAALATWNFTTGTSVGLAAVNLRTSGNYAILAETQISKTATAGTAIIGHIGISPAAATFIQGFSLTLDPTGCFSRPTPASLVTGKVFAADYNTGGCPTPANLTTAVGDMMTAFLDAKGRSIPDFTDFGVAGEIGGQTMVPGLYKYTTGVLISSNVTFAGGPSDVWILQIPGDITQASATRVVLAGGALPKNIFWQVEGPTGVAINTTAHFEGVVLASKAITVNTGATINGRLLSQTAVTLDGNAVTQPAP